MSVSCEIRPQIEVMKTEVVEYHSLPDSVKSSRK
jgi:hypothetical protein